MATRNQSRFKEVGDKVSSWMSDVSAHPFAQIGLMVFCASWFAIGLPTDLLTAALSILAITLTQMVLNRQNVREIEAHRRDIAMHAKLDELVIATKRARDEMAGIEELDEEDIIELREHAEEAIKAAEEAKRADPDSKDTADRKEVADDAVKTADTAERLGPGKPGAL